MFPQAASAWEKHGMIMPWVFSELERTAAKEPALTAVLNSKMPRVHPEIQLARYDYFSQILLLNPDAPWSSIQAENYRELLQLAVDDPDQGMDRNLPDSADPSNERRFMGGNTGLSSQGFRHMYFGGWKMAHPLASFQIPTHAIGQSPDRLELLANEAKKLIQAGDLLWGLRILGWSIHYAQDLTQPFHVVQIPSFKVIPWKTVFQWPPEKGFSALVDESTRTVGNYHRAFEIMVRDDLSRGERSNFHQCLNEPTVTLLFPGPRDLAMGLIVESQKRAHRLGNATYSYFGKKLMEPEFDLIKNPELIVPTDLAHRKEIEEITCESLRLEEAATLWLIRWAFHR